MYLACILGLCALLLGPAPGRASSDPSLWPTQSGEQAPAQPPTSQPQPGKADSPAKSDTNTKPPATKKKPASGQKKNSASANTGSPKTKVVQQGGTAEPTTQLTPGASKEQADQQRQTTNQLLSSTDAALKQISGRQLNTDQQETVTQIRKFMEQAKAADKEGDPERAYKLALKAHLLSDGLTKE